MQLSNDIDVDVALISVSIPEFGWVGGVLAVGTGAGVIALTRRRLARQGR